MSIYQANMRNPDCDLDYDISHMVLLELSPLDIEAYYEYKMVCGVYKNVDMVRLHAESKVQWVFRNEMWQISKTYLEIRKSGACFVGHIDDVDTEWAEIDYDLDLPKIQQETEGTKILRNIDVSDAISIGVALGPTSGVGVYEAVRILRKIGKPALHTLCMWLYTEPIIELTDILVELGNANIQQHLRTVANNFGDGHISKAADSLMTKLLSQGDTI